MAHFCTIITPDYIGYVKAQFQSLIKFNQEVQLYVLICTLDKQELEKDIYTNLPKGIHLHTVVDVCKTDTGNEIFNRFFHKYKDEFRWSMKPVYLCYLFEMVMADKIIYIDWNIIFFHDYDFLFNDLDNKDILLTPQWMAMSPFELHDSEEITNFHSLFSTGLYNASFVGANNKGRHLLEWWAKMCTRISNIYTYNKNQSGGYVNQVHLNLLILQSDRVGIVYHKGCNVGDGNRIECKRVLIDEKVLIDAQYPIVFIHFTNQLINSILSGKDKLLRSYIEKYNMIYFNENGKELPFYKLSRKQREKQLKIMKPHRVEKKITLKDRIKKFIDG